MKMWVITRRSRRFTVVQTARADISQDFRLHTLKRAEARAPGHAASLFVQFLRPIAIVLQTGIAALYYVEPRSRQADAAMPTHFQTCRTAVRWAAAKQRLVEK